MTIRIRRLFFWIVAVFFIITSAVILLLAQGWKLDSESLKFVKTGGIFIETSSSGAKIYIDDSYVQSTSGILSHSRLVSGLIPRPYSIFIYKEGFFPWNKTVEVKSGIVAELKDIILLPIAPKRIKLGEFPKQAVSQFYINDDLVHINNEKAKTLKIYDFSGKLISSGQYKPTTTAPFMLSPDGEKKIYAENNNIRINYLENKNDTIATYEPPIDFFDWFKDSAHVIWFSHGSLSVAEIDNRGGKANIVNFYLNINPPVFFDRDSSELYFLEQSEKKYILYKINFFD